MNTQKPHIIPIEDIPREIMKMVDIYQPSEVVDLICLQRDLNVLISNTIMEHYNLTPVEETPTEETRTEFPHEAKPTMTEIFSRAVTEMIEAFPDAKVVTEATTEQLLMEINTKYKDVTPFDEGFVSQEENTNNTNNTIYIITLPLGKYAITGYQFEKQEIEKEYGQVILGAIELDVWTTNNIERLNSNPELRDKLVQDKLLYEDFLTLEGFIECEEDPFPTKGLVVPTEVVPTEIVPTEIVYESEVDNWVPEVVHVKRPAQIIDCDIVDDIEDMDIIDPKVRQIQSVAIPTALEIPSKPEFKLTYHQQERFDGITTKIEEILQKQMQLVRPPNAAYFMTVLEGAAGTGKTTMMVKVLEKLLNDGLKIIFCSPTHQALGVIRETLRTNWLGFTESNEEYLLMGAQLIIKTLAGFLGIKMHRDEENGTESFVEDPKAAILTCDVLAIDESSMISKDQLRIILRKLHINAKCILFIGDEVQLDSPSDNNESNGIFTLPQKYALTEVVRQAADNKILQLAWEIRSYILNKQCGWYPSQILTPERTNENIIILRDQQQFLQHYLENESDSKLIATYTNKITNEYNEYVRQCRLSGTGKPLNIDIDGTGRKVLNNWGELQEFYSGEELVAVEPNSQGDDIIHQTGEKFIIDTITSEVKSIFITIQPDELLSEPELREFRINYWKIKDTNHKSIWVVKKEDIELYNEVLQYLSLEAQKSTGKFRWNKYFSIKGRFVRVNKTYAYTLHKLQGSTCEDIYVDARDLDKFFKRMPIGVYKLIYIALTRPKNRVIFLV